MQLVILAGGKGTRLGLKNIPKPMCPIAGKPLLERQVELAKSYGIDEIFILSGYKADVISNYFGDGSRYGVTIHHIIEDHPLGTAGALKVLEGKIKERFMVFYGDVVMDFDLQNFIVHDAKDISTVGTLIVHPCNHPYDSDLVEINHYDEVTAFLSKPHPSDLIYRNLDNSAVYIFSPKIFDYIEKNVMADFGKDIFPRVLREHGKLRVYRTAEYIRDMGTRDRLEQISNDFSTGLVAKLNRRNKRRAIFLDRDGTINVNMDIHPCPENMQLLPGVAEAIKKINESHYLAIVVTNQPMIAKGFTTFAEVDATNKKMETLLGNARAYVDAIYYCPHHPDKGFQGEIASLKIDCNCRKPKPGLLLRAAEDFNIDLANSYMIGDSDADSQAGTNAGCKTMQIGKDVVDLKDAVDRIFKAQK